MNIFFIGARGFIGRHAAAALEAAGHRVVAGGRPAVDFTRDGDVAAWRPRLEGIDAVVNAAGVIREAGAATFEAVHARGPSALFRACAERAIPVVQVSALGAEAGAPTAFLRSKHAADEALLALGLPCVVLQPSLVFGPWGASASLFATLAAAPFTPLPAGGEQMIQPVHVRDVARAIVRIVDEGRFTRERVAAVGPRALALREFLSTLRRQMGLGVLRPLAVPAFVVALASRMRVGLLDRDTWTMLQRGSHADARPFAALLGREPLAPEAFVDAGERPVVRRDAALGWLLPLVRLSLAAVWITAAAVSAGLYPVADSLAMLSRAGLHGPFATLALYGAAAIDLVLGLLTLSPRRPRGLWMAQAVLVLAYTAIITVALPEQWLHPFGAVVKNLPILAALAALHHLERR